MTANVDSACIFELNNGLMTMCRHFRVRITPQVCDACAKKTTDEEVRKQWKKVRVQSARTLTTSTTNAGR